MEAPTPLDRALAHFDGSQAAMARAVGYTQPGIWKVLRTGRVTPKLAALIESATGGQVTRVQLLPEVFGVAVNPASAA